MTTTTRIRPKASRWLRVLLPAVIMLGWLAAMGFGGPQFGQVSQVTSNEQADFLPVSADSSQVQQMLPDFFGEQSVPAIVVAAGDGALSDEQTTALTALVDQIAALDGVEGVSPVLPSDDGEAAQVIALIDTAGDERVPDVVEQIRGLTHDAQIDGVEILVTGPAGFTADLIEAFRGIDGVLLLVALVAVFVILVIVYRSPLLPVLVLLTSVAALTLAILVVVALARADVLPLSGQTQGILFILVVGAATDYGLLFVARFREALEDTGDRWRAALHAWRGSVEPILASGATVIAGLLCLLLSDLQSNRSLGPVAAIGIVAAMLAGLTLLPALLALVGRAAFWPFMPRVDGTTHDPAARTTGLWAWVARIVEARPRRVWLATAALLAIGAGGLVWLQPNGVPASQFVVGEAEARDGQALLAEHFPGGSGSPVYVVVPEGDLDASADTLAGIEGVDAVAVTSADAPGGQLPIPAPDVPGSPFAGAEPTVVDGEVLLQATLASAADSDAAEQVVRDIRDALPGVLVGGVTAIAVDTNDTAIHDRNLIIPIVLAVILVILMLLLRSILAPVLLIATTVLSFATALGVGAAILHLIGIPDMDPAVPLFAFVFLVALGIDYNIFLMTRVREEVVHHGNHVGVLRGLRVTGGVITSAGVVLAATFAALGVIPVLFLVQLAIIVALGVLIDTIVVRSLLVPALCLDLGPRVWWPSRLQRQP